MSWLHLSRIHLFHSHYTHALHLLKQRWSLLLNFFVALILYNFQFFFMRFFCFIYLNLRDFIWRQYISIVIDGFAKLIWFNKFLLKVEN